MKYSLYSASLFGMSLIASACYVQGQQVKEATAAPPATKLEAFSAKTGVVVIRGYTTVGAVRGMGTVTVDAREFRDASNPKFRQTGLSIEVKEAGRLEREGTSFIDYDEIDSLIGGIDYIAKIDKTVTSFNNFEVEYKTKGDLGIVTFNDSRSERSIAVSSGRFGKVSAYLKLSDLPVLRTLIVNAKAAIDSATQNAK